jgi:PEP-CTERM motif
MLCCNYFRSVRSGPGVAVGMLLLTAISWAAVPARAAINDTDWSLKISEREMAFQPATDVMAMKSLMWDLPFSRMMARSMPYISLTNDSATANITQFKMTIGDEQFHFANAFMDTFAKLGRDTPGFDLSSLVEDDGNTLVVNFLNGGLDPGDTVHFKIELGVDAAFADAFFVHPDYRTVLFDMNGDNLYEDAGIVHQVSTADNAKVSLKFEMTGMPSVTVGPVPFEDPSVVDGTAGYVNSSLARYGQTDPVRSFGLSGGSVVPEPGSMALALLGLLTMTPRFARRRRPTLRIALAA